MHAVLGLALGFIFSILLSEVVRISPAEYKISAMGFFQSFYALGIFLGPLLTVVFAEKSSLNDVFTFTGVGSFVIRRSHLCFPVFKTAKIFFLLTEGVKKGMIIVFLPIQERSGAGFICLTQSA
jgi:MFS family permease